MSEIDLVRQAALQAAQNGELLSRDAVLRAHVAELERAGRSEPVSVSEAWANHLWNRLERADLQGLAHKARHADQFAKLVGPLLGQP